MNAELLLLALCVGFGVGCLLAALKALLAAAWLRVRGLRVMGTVTSRTAADRRPGALVLFSDHLGRDLLLDPGRYAPLCGLPAVGRSVPVVYRRERPTVARLWNTRHLLAPSFGWFLTAAVAFGTGVVVGQ
ncbi:hypothetical protein [Streptomyces shenzhenensis]|uniref:DUF3592 domain-containing protein n=1 Tax=Streptomyces shenzhenensis TaxID=943815 RepID=A0A3M0I764_9ACTN|nr:hypothetical protein [Streptomyces shenzhenensis]RMB84614.1 hypothetical protein CTZ28_18000 [Streptomyces shenzhenensis]